MQLRTLGGVSISVSVAKVLSNESACTVGKVATIDLFWCMVQLMAIPIAVSMLSINGCMCTDRCSALE